MKAFEAIKDEDGSFVCPYCKAKYKGSAGLYQHFRFKHGLSSKDVYDDLCKKDTDGICIICGRETAFKNGRYLLTCSPECKAKWFSIDEMRAQKISHSRRKYSTAITVWTIQDPIKRETAEKNNLNYVVLWNLEEIERYKNALLERVLHTGIHNLA